MEFHERVKKIRKELKFTQKQVSVAIEMAERTYQSLEYGKFKPSFDTLVKLCKYLNASADYLLGFKEINER